MKSNITTRIKRIQQSTERKKVVTNYRMTDVYGISEFLSILFHVMDFDFYAMFWHQRLIWQTLDTGGVAHVRKQCIYKCV